MSSINISAVDVDASSGSSWNGSDSELEVEVTHVVQQQKEEEEEELDLELDESHKSSKTSPLPPSPRKVCRRVHRPVQLSKRLSSTFSQTPPSPSHRHRARHPLPKKKKNGRGKADGKAAARGGGSRCLPNSTRSSAAHREDKSNQTSQRQEEGSGGRQGGREGGGGWCWWKEEQAPAHRAQEDSKGRVSARQRIEQFPEESLEEVDGKIIYRACQKGVTTEKKSAMATHCNGDLNRQALAVFKRKKRSKQTTLTFFRQYSNSLGGIYGSLLSDRDLTTQIMAVEGCLSAGIPLNALANPLFRDFLHHAGAKLPAGGHLSNHIPFIEKKDMNKVIEEVGDSNYSVCFDGTPTAASASVLAFVSSTQKDRYSASAFAEHAHEVYGLRRHQRRSHEYTCRRLQAGPERVPRLHAGRMRRQPQSPRILADPCGASPTSSTTAATTPQQLRQRARIGGSRQVRWPLARPLGPQPKRQRPMGAGNQGITSEACFPPLELAVFAEPDFAAHLARIEARRRQVHFDRGVQVQGGQVVERRPCTCSTEWHPPRARVAAGALHACGRRDPPDACHTPLGGRRVSATCSV
ncbi:unnamed protein product [Ascophyllum nodosum]